MTLRRAWTESSYTTKEFLYPERPPVASRFPAAWRFLGGEVSGAARAGALLVRGMLMRRCGVSHHEAVALVAGFEDDTIIRVGAANILWVSRWLDAVAAERFAGLYRKALPDGKIETDGTVVIATIGEVGDRERILSVLR